MAGKETNWSVQERSDIRDVLQSVLKSVCNFHYVFQQLYKVTCARSLSHTHTRTRTHTLCLSVSLSLSLPQFSVWMYHHHGCQHNY
jgi:hypothetical protein